MTESDVRRTAMAAPLVDVLAVAVFVLIGRGTHAEGLTVAGLVETAAPFLAALGLGWLVARAWRAPDAPRTGAAIWAVTVVGGLALRWLVTGRLPLPFAVVTAITLAVLLLGWRLVVTLSRRRQVRRS